MPRSKDPRNYGPFYDKLAELMDRGQHEIQLTMSGKLAIYHRNNFYAYINAWKCHGKSIPGNKALTPESKIKMLEYASRREDVMRRYLVVIDPEPNPELETVQLRFILRGMDERQREGIEQLDIMIAKAEERGDLSRDEILRRLQGQPMQAVDTAKMRDADSPVAHFFGGVKTAVDPDMTEEMADEILKGVPIDRTDLTDLITPSIQVDEPTPDYMEEALKSSKKLRAQEKKQSKKSA
ncbi:hypothetical protein LCGC14_1017050 [marine sediment metagenome]|uniref:Uncharacterized protein n=1 Tax=marine sediment metagenome TaxID=412755 RepID=A0A0F9N375_9ZZZZ